MISQYPKTPVLVYQMGKVASTTISRTISTLPQFAVAQVHRLNLENIERIHLEHQIRGWKRPNDDIGFSVIEKVIRPCTPSKVITLVRDPIRRNISYYFQNLDKILGVADAHNLPFDTIIDGFQPNFPFSDDALTWFDYEFNAMLGVDVYQSGYKAGAPSHRWQSGLYDILILQSDAADSEKLAALEEFLDVRGLDLRVGNVTVAKAGAHAYRQFLNAVKFPRRYIDATYDSKYAQYFFDSATLSAWRSAYECNGWRTPEPFVS